MLVLIGAVIVVASCLGGFMLAGGNPLVLLHVSEFVVIFGVGAGLLVIASPGHVLSQIVAKTREAILSKSPTRNDYFDLLKLLYELFVTGRRNGLIALEEHVMDPTQSSLFKRYPGVLNHADRRKFIVNSLTPVLCLLRGDSHALECHDKEKSVGWRVLRDQDFSRGAAPCEKFHGCANSIVATTCRCVCRRTRQRDCYAEPEPRPLSNLRGNADVAAHLSCELSHKRKAKPGAARFARVRPVEL